MTVQTSVPPNAPTDQQPDVPTRPTMPLAEYLQHFSEDEFYAFCQKNRDQKFERRSDGTIELLTMTGGKKGNRNLKIAIRLGVWSESNQLGLAFDSSTDFRLPNGAVRSPDAAWVRAEVWQAQSAEQQEKFPPLCPDFVVELLSSSDSLPEIVLKMQEYIANGCRLAWLIDPKTETARTFRADGSVSVTKSFDETLTGEDVLPGFAFALALLR